MSRSTDPSSDLPFLFVPDWDLQQPGDRVSVVVADLVWDGNVAVGRLVPSDQVVRLNGLLPDGARGFSKVTVLSASFLACSTLVDLALDETSKLLGHHPLTVSRLSNLVEVCAGAGLSSLGFGRVGFKHCCSVELRPKLASLHASVHPGVEVICADVTRDDTAGLIYEACHDPGVLMAGIACQPYSRGGSQQGELDSRSLTLPGTLRLCFLLQIPIMVLECVALATSHAYVQNHMSSSDATSI